ncbi:hypothetical protein H5410_001747 [Solanum commersonii]|uniref:Uncharacterized protein n=1 Tax=Solanum commersonii TaxID=4109 RepID=A0A9J6AZX0_SOLCO|nr:hypothetical protein H5410_001747 [Solanum commersonii]
MIERLTSFLRAKVINWPNLVVRWYSRRWVENRHNGSFGELGELVEPLDSSPKVHISPLI